jgi:hypothetical protein
VLFVDFVFVFLVTLGALAISSFRLLNVATNQTKLADLAEIQLWAKLESAIDYSWAIAKGNQVLIDALSTITDFKVQYSPLAAHLVDDQWAVISVAESLRIDDINAKGLIEILESLPAPPVSDNPTATIGAGTPTLSTPDVYVCRIAGDQVRSQNPLIAVRTASFGEFDLDQFESGIRRMIRGTVIAA